MTNLLCSTAEDLSAVGPACQWVRVLSGTLEKTVSGTGGIYFLTTWERKCHGTIRQGQKEFKTSNMGIGQTDLLYD